MKHLPLLSLVSMFSLVLTEACMVPAGFVQGPNAAATTSTSGSEGASADPSGAMEGGYKADVSNCMDGKPIASSSLIGGPTCPALRRANQSGDASDLPRGVASTFRQIRKERGLETQP